MTRRFKELREVRPDAVSWAGAARATPIIDAHRTLPGAMLPLLHALQAEFGYVPPEAEPMIAAALNLSRAEVYGVISFYHDFRREPAGRAARLARPDLRRRPARLTGGARCGARQSAAASQARRSVDNIR